MDAVMREGDHVAVIRSEREKRKASLREAYQLIKHRSGESKGVRHIMDMLREHEILDDFIAEHGGEEVTLSVLLARITNGEPPGEVCGHYGLDYGIVWDFLTETKERRERLYAAQEGLAESDMAQTVPIADSATPEDVAVQALRIKARQGRAAAYNPKRFGTAKAGAAVGGTGLVIDAALTFAAAELLGRIARPAEKVVSEQ